ncbi:hypothetical protein FSP39_009220 [Pinctada imbricata]|uniref:Phosphatidic acid phosphatase type 2/haloperoxidase domain-containing protein n=1 Tax=Pinctada imbricata TaxID=66713 RepID=A0AA88Y9S6_PINIB|nr:hypothetical protein FSP39_009220 [Pinctada imbricata]
MTLLFLLLDPQDKEDVFSDGWLCYTEDAVPYFRKIQPEEYWLYNFPRTPSYYPGYLLWITISSVPTIVIILFMMLNSSKTDAIQASLGASLSILLAGSVTNSIKLVVGRPRPDFLARCFPDGSINDNMECIGKEADVIQGYKSFPSGHSSYVTVGSILGLFLAYTCYRQHYPPLNKLESHLPYVLLPSSSETVVDDKAPILPLVSGSETKDSLLKLV